MPTPNAAGDLSESEYELLSNPDESDTSIPDLGAINLALPTSSRDTQPHEPPAQAQWAASVLSAENIQVHVAKQLQSYHEGSTRDSMRTLRGSNPNGGKGAEAMGKESRKVRVYVDGLWDGLNVAHVHQLRQAKLSFPDVHLIVGALPDVSGIPALVPHGERCEMLRHCRWVDEIISEPQRSLDFDFVHRMRIDYVAIDEGTSVDPACEKERLKGYDTLKKMGKIITTRRTIGMTVFKAKVQPPLQPQTLRGATLPLAPSSSETDDPQGPLAQVTQNVVPDTPFGLPLIGGEGAATPVYSSSRKDEQQRYEQMDIFGIGL